MVCVICESKTEAHRQYRYATRRYMIKVEELRKVRMTEAICDNRSRDFFREMKKLNPKVSAAPIMDGHADRGHIADHLTNKYDELYNSFPSDEENMDRIKDYISEYCEKCDEHDRVVNQHDVDKALDYL